MPETTSAAVLAGEELVGVIRGLSASDLSNLPASRVGVTICASSTPREASGGFTGVAMSNVRGDSGVAALLSPR
jgi:hypothetical protein